MLCDLSLFKNRMSCCALFCKMCALICVYYIELRQPFN
uniref:Uncharacterized protein n=1 Tax=Anguilla anguilla TaxID=7936 RepID=A0A0E9TE62_ANGAN